MSHIPTSTINTADGLRPRALRLRQGSTMIEVLTAAVLSVMVLSSVVAALLSGMQSWARGAGKIHAETSSQQSLRTVSNELREAMSVTVDANGRGLSYRIPEKDGDGSYIVPAQWDGVSRRIYVNEAGSVFLGPAGGEREIAGGLVLMDPKRSMASYRPFVPGLGSIVRRLDVMFVIRQYGAGANYEYSRIRETIYLRNIPSLSQ